MRTAQTVKNALKKEEDPAKALMSYRATPLENGYSPAEMLFGRKIQITIPVALDQLKPSWPDVEKIWEHEQESKLSQMHRYNARYRCKDLPERKVGESAWVGDQKTPAVVTKNNTTPRSDTVKTEAGTPIRRNRRHLVPMPTDDSAPIGQQSESPAESPQVNAQTELGKTRYGRSVKPPTRLRFTYFHIYFKLLFTSNCFTKGRCYVT